jgi:hypothetical protein
MLKVSFEINESDVSTIPFAKAINMSIAPVVVRADPIRLNAPAQGVVMRKDRFSQNRIDVPGTLKAHGITLADLNNITTSKGSWQYAVKLASRLQKIYR